MRSSRADQADVDVVQEQSIENLLRYLNSQLQMHRRQCFTEGSHSPREDPRQRCRGREADPEIANFAAGGALGGFDGPRRLGQCSARFDQEQLAGFGQFDLPPVAVEQCDAKFPLDRLDLQA